VPPKQQAPFCLKKFPSFMAAFRHLILPPSKLFCRQKLAGSWCVSFCRLGGHIGMANYQLGPTNTNPYNAAQSACQAKNNWEKYFETLQVTAWHPCFKP
jgi:hypothetical protein